jgi:hypothetical protein
MVEYKSFVIKIWKKWRNNKNIIKNNKMEK